MTSRLPDVRSVARSEHGDVPTPAGRILVLDHLAGRGCGRIVLRKASAAEPTLPEGEHVDVNVALLHNRLGLPSRPVTAS